MKAKSDWGKQGQPSLFSVSQQAPPGMWSRDSKSAGVGLVGEDIPSTELECATQSTPRLRSPGAPRLPRITPLRALSLAVFEMLP